MTTSSLWNLPRRCGVWSSASMLLNAFSFISPTCTAAAKASWLCHVLHHYPAMLLRLKCPCFVMSYIISSTMMVRRRRWSVLPTRCCWNDCQFYHLIVWISQDPFSRLPFNIFLVLLSLVWFPTAFAEFWILLLPMKQIDFIHFRLSWFYCFLELIFVVSVIALNQFPGMEQWIEIVLGDWVLSLCP